MDIREKVNKFFEMLNDPFASYSLKIAFNNISKVLLANAVITSENYEIPQEMKQLGKEILIDLKPYVEEELNTLGMTQDEIKKVIKTYKETPKIYELRKQNNLSLRKIIKVFKFYVD